MAQETNHHPTIRVFLFTHHLIEYNAHASKKEGEALEEGRAHIFALRSPKMIEKNGPRPLTRLDGG